ncbi:hypothetical protein AgCh_016834 [Apium graveolens]
MADYNIDFVGEFSKIVNEINDDPKHIEIGSDSGGTATIHRTTKIVNEIDDDPKPIEIDSDSCGTATIHWTTYYYPEPIDLSDVYNAKVLWDKLDQTHNTDSQGLEKYFVVRFLEFKLVDEKSMTEEVHEFEMWVHALGAAQVQIRTCDPVENGNLKVNVVTVGQKRKVVTKKANTKPDKNKAKKSKANKSCWSCEKVDHWSKDCPSKKAKKNGVVTQANTVLGLGTTSEPVANMIVGEVVVSRTEDDRDDDISVTILLMDLPADSDLAAFTRNLKKDAPQGVVFVDIPALDETTMAEIMSMPWLSFLTSFIEKQQSQVRNVVAIIVEQSKTSKLCGFVIDLFCTSMIEVPVKILPSMMLTEEGSAHNKATVRRIKESKVILINTVMELEAPAIKFITGDGEPLAIYHVGPIINFKSSGTSTKDKTTEEAIITWLDSQPPLSVVYLYFGSIGSFHIEQVKEIAQVLEVSGQRFLWSLRRIGKVVGWTPQVSILSHPSVGGFVSHFGWNSTLESIWYGVPIATWPMFADQQINAFHLVVELGIATEIKMDNKVDIFANIESTPVERSQEIERGIRCLMDGESEMMRKMKEMKEACRKATVQGGSSYTSLGQFLQDVKSII